MHPEGLCTSTVIHISIIGAGPTGHDTVNEYAENGTRRQPVPGRDHVRGYGDPMGVLGLLRKDGSATDVTRKAMREVRSGKAEGDEHNGVESALQTMVESFRDIGLDGKFNYSSAEDVARRASKRFRRKPKKAVRRVVRKHRRGVTVAGFLTGLGGLFTLPLLLPANVFTFYVQATRMVGAIAAIRGYDLDDEEIRSRVLAALVGEESEDVLASLGLGPIAGAATRQIAKRVPLSPSSAVARAIGGRMLRRFGLRSVRLFGKAIPGLGGIIGAWSDRRMLKKIARTAMESFPYTA